MIMSMRGEASIWISDGARPARVLGAVMPALRDSGHLQITGFGLSNSAKHYSSRPRSPRRAGDCKPFAPRGGAYFLEFSFTCIRLIGGGDSDILYEPVQDPTVAAFAVELAMTAECQRLARKHCGNPEMSRAVIIGARILDGGRDVTKWILGGEAEARKAAA